MSNLPVLTGFLSGFEVASSMDFRQALPTGMPKVVLKRSWTL